MYTMTLLAQKGGTGKTTLAINLAVVAETEARRAVPFDPVPQARLDGACFTVIKTATHPESSAEASNSPARNGSGRKLDRLTRILAWVRRGHPTTVQRSGMEAGEEPSATVFVPVLGHRRPRLGNGQLDCRLAAIPRLAQVTEREPGSRMEPGSHLACPSGRFRGSPRGGTSRVARQRTRDASRFADPGAARNSIACSC